MKRLQNSESFGSLKLQEAIEKVIKPITLKDVGPLEREYIINTIKILSITLRENYPNYDTKSPNFNDINNNNQLILYTVWEQFCQIQVRILMETDKKSRSDKKTFVEKATSTIKYELLLTLGNIFKEQDLKLTIPERHWFL